MATLMTALPGFINPPMLHEQLDVCLQRKLGSGCHPLPGPVWSYWVPSDPSTWLSASSEDVGTTSLLTRPVELIR
jgi:hypothetical protein